MTTSEDVISAESAPEGIFPGQYAWAMNENLFFTATGEKRIPVENEYYLAGGFARKATAGMTQRCWIAVSVARTICPCCNGLGRIVAGE
jgi:hypothetical protein